MKTYDELLQRWNNCQGGQILVDHLHPIRMYLNITATQHRELLIPVEKPVSSFRSTEAIGIRNYKNSDGYFFGIELLSENLINEYACLCFDLIESSRGASSGQGAIKVLFATFMKWYTLMASARVSILSDREIRGLMGELMFISDIVECGFDENKLIDAWTTHKDASRDFIFDDTWCEIKSIKTSNDYITVSSLDQLDHNMDGKLVVYRLDSVDITVPNAYTLNSLVDLVKGKLGIDSRTELSRKLLSKGYTANELYDSLFYIFGKKSTYNVDASFPRISKDMISPAISAAEYEILLSKVEEWREKDG